MLKPFFTFILFIILTTLSAQNYSATLANYEAYKAFKGKPLSDKFSNIESVKVIYDLKKQKMHYFNSTLIRLHYDFVTNYLGYTKDLDIFNDTNYSNTDKNREFLLGNLNHIKGTDKWIFELAASDHMPILLIERFYNLIVSSSFIGKDLKFYLNNPEQIEWLQQQKLKFRVSNQIIFLMNLRIRKLFQEVISVF